MEVKASYGEAHLVVAAIRVLSHLHDGRPPTIEEVSTHLKMSNEWTGVLVRAMERSGIVRSLTGPFATRIEIDDHQKLEQLSRKDSTAQVDEELREFSERKRKEEEKLQKLFGGDALKNQRKKMDRLADQFMGYKPKEPKTPPVIDDPGSKDDQ